MVPMAKYFRDRLEAGLKRKSATTPSKWAETYRVMGQPFPGPWSFKHHPWLRGMHDSTAESNVGQKAAQMGYTECMLNLTFYNIDYLRRDCLYVLPAKTPDAADFSSGRFGPALSLSPYLEKLFDDVQNIGHKSAGGVNLYVRGAKSESGLKSLPAGFLVLDELNEMSERAIALALERQSGQLAKQNWMISTPTQEDAGINAEYKHSTQEEFFFQCPGCSKHINLMFPDNLVIIGDDPDDPKVMDSYLKCNYCEKKLEHKEKPDFLGDGIWVPKVDPKIMLTRGFYINQLYSPAIQPGHIAIQYLKSLSDQIEEQEFYNSKLGMPHVVQGARITNEDINQCIGDYFSHVDGYYLGAGSKVITMGIDVGQWCHVVVIEWTFPPKKFVDSAVYNDPNSRARAKVIAARKVRTFPELDEMMRQYSVNFAVIDNQPEVRLSYAFTQRFFGRSKSCNYANGLASRQIVPSPEQEQRVNADRTSWLDMTLGRFHRGKEALLIPKDIDLEYRENLQAQAKIYSKDKKGNAVSRYDTPKNKKDHYGHAQNYAEIALPFALGQGISESINVNM